MIPQALHIFRKDCVYLRIPLAVLLLITFAFSFAQNAPQLSTPAVILLCAAVALVIARLVHAESIAGTSQFWITRPYNWKSLLIAKLLFVMVWIDIPIGLARLGGLIWMKYPIAASILPLLWAQLLLFGILAAVVALTSLTAGIVDLILAFLGTTLVAAVVLLGTRSILLRRIPEIRFWPNSVEWIPLCITGALGIVITAYTLRWQYRERRTRFSRTFVIAGAIVTELVSLAIPVTAGLRIQSLFSRVAAPDVQIAFAGFGSPDLRSLADRFQGVVRVPISVRLSGIPKNDEVRPDLSDVRITWAGGEIAKGPSSLFATSNHDGQVTLKGVFAMPAAAFYRFKMTPATLRMSMYLTLFGEAQSRTVPFDNIPRNVGDGLQCFTTLRGELMDNNFGVYNCRGFFGWPSRLVSVSTGDEHDDFTKLVSYAPFPSGPSLDSSEGSYVTLSWGAKDGPPKNVTVTIKRPLVHFHRDFEAAEVRLDNSISNR